MSFRLAAVADRESHIAEPALNYSSHRISQSEHPPKHVNHLNLGSCTGLPPKGSVKRRKTAGLNNRFDRMIETVNVIHTADSARSSSRRRRATSGSSSATSFDVPKTPVDMFNVLEGGRLGEDFSVLKMNTLSRRISGGDDVQSHFNSTNFLDTTTEDGAPTWLSETIASLAPEHPLRDLVPVSEAHIARFSPRNQILAPISPRPNDLEHRPAPPEDDIFAFQPPSPQAHALVNNSNTDQALSIEHRALSLNGHTISSIPGHITDGPNFVSENAFHNALFVTSPLHANDAFLAPSSVCSNRFESIEAAQHYTEDSDYVPFSTPGPFSSKRRSLDYDPSSEVGPILESTPPFSKPGPLVRPVRPIPVRSPSPDIFRPSYSSPRSAGGFARGRTTPPDLENVFDTPISSGWAPIIQPLHSSPKLTRPSHAPKSAASPTLHRRTSEHEITPFRQPGRYKVYFDSPTEDPIGSDPLVPPDYELDLDYDVLDFRWEKFDRSGERSGEPEPLPQDPTSSEDTQINPHVQNPTVDSQMASRSPLIDRSKRGLHVDVNEPMLDEQYDLVGVVRSMPTASEGSPPCKNHFSMEETFVSTAKTAQAGSDHVSDAKAPTSSPPKKDTAIQPKEPQLQTPTLRSLGTTSVEPALPQDIPFPLPKTPVKQLASILPKTPTAPRTSARRRRSLSLPPIAVLPDADETQAEDEIETEPKLSQVSHDTIESWSAP
ncbi:hypothetical protein NM688_g4716 [Phlebia brevispora]|uniref:Uncharacterized protein n=1 Tax=Phlebia brevispora TaxID=194682 RepID=A0ACC1T2R3_9APHY|nr:hypothetical protein NM688_g4716 [Phlebia brevispora]